MRESGRVDDKREEGFWEINDQDQEIFSTIYSPLLCL